MDRVPRAWIGELQSIEREASESLDESDFRAALSGVNQKKNRYTNVLANEKTRVKLQGFQKPTLSRNYINANYVSGVSGPRQYIATQAPLQESMEDFWKMIWEHRVPSIIMLTNVVENGIPKADRYWPTTNMEEMTFGNFKVELESEAEKDFGVVRILRVSYKNTTKGIEQVHFQKWPDHGVPEPDSSMRHLVEYIDAREAREKDVPTVIHCSAGLGRTGTLIAIHWTNQRLEAGEDLRPQDFRQTVLSLKQQRFGMIQSGEQLRFFYKYFTGD
ncbi:hypothetical protein NDN08_006998 [Rhodosorus marinus]|uniref:Protein-tyrosine-phosphatase n=1 Tax=Rhodosorus marinus TaxID=101924 RepID=A0AAV8UMV0_9RHOD|nr:hypothetical protein NDN08_006998 [Rhodosorus marinus]